MNLQVTARRFQLSEKLENLVQKEVHDLEKHFDNIQDVNVVLTTDHGVRHVDVTIHVPNHVMNSEIEGAEQFITLVPTVMKKAGVQLQRYKEKLKKL
ncbi:MAG: ribosome-associated translation inhibitor RaiA [bacterium]|nr:ribosome-associated translation inhibitor RaiA [bacterium]